MASIPPSHLILYDNVPGAGACNTPKPYGGWDTTSAGNRATSDSQGAGKKVIRYQDATVGAGGSYVANAGWYTMVYAMYMDFTTGDCSAGAPVTLACNTAGARGKLTFARDITSGNDVTISGSCAAIACTSIGDDEFGWFWCGGVCPNYDCTTFDISGFAIDGTHNSGTPLGVNVADSSQVTLGVADLTATLVVVGMVIGDVS